MDKQELQKEYTETTILYWYIDLMKKDIIEQFNKLEMIVLRRAEEIELLLSK